MNLTVNLRFVLRQLGALESLRVRGILLLLALMTLQVSSASAVPKCWKISGQGVCNDAHYDYYACGERAATAHSYVMCGHGLSTAFIDGMSIMTTYADEGLRDGTISITAMPAGFVSPPSSAYVLGPGCSATCSSPNSCPPNPLDSSKTQHRWPSNGRCYLCPEGQVWSDNGAGTKGCIPRCQGLQGAALTACRNCNVSGGAACRCNQLSGAAREQCMCSAFGGGAACFQCPDSAPYKWADKSCRSCPEGTPYNWSNNSCNVCPESTPHKWTNGQCNKCPEATPYDDGQGGCSKCPSTRPLRKGLKCYPDADLDRVEDARDNCPTVPNTNQVDADQNGKGDACDKCNKNWRLPTGFYTALSTESTAIRNYKGAPLKGDKVTLESFLDSCADGDVESLTIEQKSGGTWSTQTQRQKITKEFVSNADPLIPSEGYTGRITNTGLDVFGWATVKKVCPPDTEVLSCPTNTSNRCTANNLASWRSEKLNVWEEQVATLVADHFPLLPFVNLVEGLQVSRWITIDAMAEPPYLYPAPVGVSTIVEEGEFESRVSSRPAGSLTPPDLLRIAFDVVGCGSSRCSDDQWVRAMLAGHNVLKNVASLMRNTAGCTADVYIKAWVTHPPSPQTAEDICKVHSQRELDWIIKANRKILNSKFTTWKKIAQALQSFRPSCYDNGNTLGSAYHLFGFGLVNFYSSGLMTYPANFIEKTAQTLVGNNDPVYKELNDMEADAMVRGYIQRIP